MTEWEWFMVMVISLLLVVILAGALTTRSQSSDRDMCEDAGMSWVEKERGVECDSNID